MPNEKFKDYDVSLDNSLAFKRFYELAGECMKSTDIKLRLMATQLYELALSMPPGDDSAPYHRLYDLEEQIHTYIKHSGFAVANKRTTESVFRIRPDGEPDLTSYIDYTYRTSEHEPPLSNLLRDLINKSSLIHSQTQSGMFNMTMNVFLTPGLQYVVVEKYTHIDGYTYEQMQKQVRGHLDEGFDHGYQVYSITKEEYEAKQGNLRFRIFEPLPHK